MVIPVKCGNNLFQRHAVAGLAPYHIAPVRRGGQIFCQRFLFLKVMGFHPGGFGGPGGILCQGAPGQQQVYPLLGTQGTDLPVAFFGDIAQLQHICRRPSQGKRPSVLMAARMESGLAL